MRARQKLNDIYITGGLIAAALVGFVTSSGVAFLLTSSVLIGLGYAGGAIRPTRRHR